MLDTGPHAEPHLTEASGSTWNIDDRASAFLRLSCASLVVFHVKHGAGHGFDMNDVPRETLMWRERHRRRIASASRWGDKGRWTVFVACLAPDLPAAIGPLGGDVSRET